MVKPVSTRTVVSSVFADDKDVPKSDLPRRLQSMKEYLVDAVAIDCRQFAKVLAEWQDYGLYKEFEDTWEAFVNLRLEKPLEWVDLMIEGAAILDGTDNSVLVSGSADPQEIAQKIIAQTSPEFVEALALALSDLATHNQQG